MTQKNVLVLYAHPSHARSEVNRPMFEAACRIDGVTAVDLYGEYPTFNMNVPKEQQRLLEHDVIIFQFPLFWYSTPAILKEWQDLVLEYGFAYGGKNKILQGKIFFCALSAGGKEDAYQTDGYMHYTIGELLRPLEQMARMTDMEYLPPFALFGSRRAAEQNRLEAHIASWNRLLKALVRGSVNLAKAREGDLLNRYVPEWNQGAPS